MSFLITSSRCRGRGLSGGSGVTPAFSDSFATGDLTHEENDFSWKTPDGNDAVAGTGANGSFTRTSGSWGAVNSQTGRDVYLQTTSGNVQGGHVNVIGPFTVTSNTTTVLSFVGNATGAVQTRTNRPAVVTTIGRTDSNSIGFTFGPDLDLVDSRSQAGFNFPIAGVGELWVEYYLYIPANFAHRTQGDGENNNKFFGLFARDQVVDSSRMLFDFELEPDGSGGASIFAQSVFSNGLIGSGAVRVNGDSGFEGDDPIGAATLGAFNRIRIHLKSETADSAADGEMQLWIGATEVFRASGRRFGYPSAVGSAWHGTYPALIDNGYFLGAANTGYDELTIFYIDDVKFYTVNPGW